MASPQRLVPEIRFEGFSDEWERRKLSNMVSYISSCLTAKDARENGLYDLYDANSIIGKTDVAPIRKEYISVIKDGAGVGRVRMLPKDSLFIGTMGALVADRSDLRFVYSLLNRFSLANDFSGSTIPHIYFKDYGNNEYLVPTLIEQKAIGSYFDKIDRLIDIHQRKYDRLKNVKKSMLEKMFPRDGANVSEIRFAGFTDAWEQRKLTEFVNFFSGLTYTPRDVQKAGTLVLRSSNVSNGEIVDADNVYVSPDVVNSENVKEGDIIVVVRNGSRSLIGKHAQIKRFMPNTVIGAFMTGIRSECPSFTNALLNTPHFDEEISMNMGATINQITGYMFSKMEFSVPSLDEQKKIGAFFENLDNLITLHQRKYEKLEQIKKSLLQKMFV